MKIEINDTPQTKSMCKHHRLQANKAYEVISTTHGFYYIANPLSSPANSNIAKTVAISKTEAKEI